MTPASGSINLLEQLTELREPRTFTSLKDAIKDAGEQPNKGILGSVPSIGRLSPWRWAALPTPHSVDVFTNLQAPQTPYCWDFYGGFIRSPWPIIKSIFSPSPFSRECGCTVEIPSFWSWLVLSGDQPPSRSHPGAHSALPHWDKTHSCHPGNYKGFRSPMSGTRVKAQILEQTMLLVLLSLRKLRGFQELCARNQGQRPIQ